MRISSPRDLRRVPASQPSRAGEATVSLELGFYPFVVGDMVKLYLAAALLPSAWRLIGERRDS